MVEATMCLEVEVGISGTFTPGYPASGPTYSCGGEPGQEDMVEDVEVTSFRVNDVDLLAQLSPGAREEVLTALTGALAEEAEEKLLEEVDDGY